MRLRSCRQTNERQARRNSHRNSKRYSERIWSSLYYQRLTTRARNGPYLAEKRFHLVEHVFRARESFCLFDPAPKTFYCRYTREQLIVLFKKLSKNTLVLSGV